ncbi:MAG: transposase [Bifidobacteriaceae bacterium]|jgi:REP element-mobilizing transposase RayT|nr:transposase [Bifidobacteriaceae bacterium]
MVRGVNREPVFRDDADRRRFLDSLRRAKGQTGVKVLAYALMGNHVHLLVECPADTLSALVHRAGGRYAQWFNHRYQRIGHLFQNRFKSLPVTDTDYLATAVTYIHLNPVRANLSADATSYPWSSRQAWFRPSDATDLVDVDRLGELVDLGALKLQEVAALATHRANWGVRDPFESRPAGRPASFSQAEAAAAFAAVSGVSDRQAFAGLPLEAQRDAVVELRSAGVSERTVARLTGWSRYFVRRALDGGVAQPPGRRS